MRIQKRNELRLILFFSLLISLTANLVAAQTGDNSNSTLQFKHLAGGAEEIIAMRLPDPATLGTTSKTAVIPIRSNSGEAQFLEIPVDNTKDFRLMLLAPDNQSWQILAALPGDSFFNLRQDSLARGVQKTETTYGFDGDNFPAEVFEFNSLQTGVLRVRITTPKAIENSEKTIGYLVASSDSPYRLYSYVNTFATVVKGKIGLVTSLREYSEVDKSSSSQLIGSIRNAVVTLKKPNGENTTLTMQDEGDQTDGDVGDGVFGTSFMPDVAGKYVAQITASGVTPEGAEFIRTSEHIFNVIGTRAAIGQNVAANQVDDLRWRLALPVTGFKAGQKVLTHAEVWARDAEGSEQPIAWIGGMSLVEKAQRSKIVSLTLDARWIAGVLAKENYELRNVRLQDPDYFVLLATADALSLPKLSLPEAAKSFTGEVTDEMRMGARPDALVGNAVGGKLLLVHGYCSSNPWNSAQFADAAVFTDLYQNRSHDQFAQLIRNFGAQFPSFGVVAHSQGGAASLHLYTYYWSGLDYATGSRLIQSVGTPYQGTALAGNLAVIGAIFGAGCGSNYDLTYSGAAAWLSGIPNWARAKVFYHTTSFTDVWWRYDYCQLASDLILNDPDDGVVERAYAQLSGANNLGHKTGWCHIRGMRDPAQTDDSARNANMNVYAAR